MSLSPSGPTRSARSARQRARVTALTGALAAGLILAACSSSSSSSSAASGTSGSADPSATGSANLSDVTITFGFQTADNPALLKASGLFNNLPYKLSTPVISGPANEIAALNSKAIDVGLVGENTAAFQDANAATAWTASTAQVSRLPVTRRAYQSVPGWGLRDDQVRDQLAGRAEGPLHRLQLRREHLRRLRQGAGTRAD